MDLPLPVKGIAGLRVGIGALSVLAPRAAAKAFRFPASDLTPGALGMAGMFGVREAVLGVITATAAEAPPERRRTLFRLNAVVDAVDAAVLCALAVKHKGMRLPALLVLPIAATSVAGHLKAAQEVAA